MSSTVMQIDTGNLPREAPVTEALGPHGGQPAGRRLLEDPARAPLGGGGLRSIKNNSPQNERV